MKKAILKITSDLCKACLLCLEVCKKNCLSQGEVLNTAGYLTVVFEDNGKCNGCALCAVRCPEVAIEIYQDE